MLGIITNNLNISEQNQVPPVQQVYDTKKLYRRWWKCLQLSVGIASVGLIIANNWQTQIASIPIAALMRAFPIRNVPMIKQPPILIPETYNLPNIQATDVARSAIIYNPVLYFAFMFLLASVSVTTLYWVVEEGLVDTFLKSIAEFGRSCVNAITNTYSWIRNKFTQQPDNLNKSSLVTSELKKEKKIPVAMLQHKTLMPSGGPGKVYPTSSAQPEDLLNREEESRPRSRPSSLTKRD